jgi:hypothetical protein
MKNIFKNLQNLTSTLPIFESILSDIFWSFHTKIKNIKNIFDIRN